MLLMFQIAGGIILAIFLLHSMGRSYLSYIDWRERRAARKYFAGRVRRQEEAGWRWDPDSFSSYEEQLQRWEAEHTFERRAQRALEAGWCLRSNTILTPEQQLRLWEWETKRAQGFRSQPAPRNLALFRVYPSERSEPRLMASLSADAGQGAA